MITYLETNLFDSPAQALVNTVNTVGVMGKGIALSFKKLYPAMFEQYRQLCEQGKLDVGKLHIYPTPNKIIINFPTKKDWRNPSKVDYIEAGLKAFVACYTDYGISSAAFPQLGCGNGELDWVAQVQPLMEQYLHPLPIQIYIHLYTRSKDFIPERLDASYRHDVMRERRQYTFDDVWADLQTIAGGSAETMSPINVQGVKAWLGEDKAHFVPSVGVDIAMHRDDIEELWNTLRLRGTTSCQDMPPAIDASQASEWLLDLFDRLEYVKSIMIRPKGSAFACRGLQFSPEPQLIQTTLHNALVIA